MDTLDPVHERGAQLIYQQGHPQKSNGLAIGSLKSSKDTFSFLCMMFFKTKFQTPLSPSSKQRGKEYRLIGATKLKSQE